MKRLLKALIRAYTFAISPLLGANCRFYPTCSVYAQEAIDRHGAMKGSVMAAKRLLCCHPYYKGSMMDEVPASIDWRQIIGYKRAKAGTACKTGSGCECSNRQNKEDDHNATT